MTRAALCAGAAGVLGVLAAWDALTALERADLPGAVVGVLRPLARAGDEGRAPTLAERRRLQLLGAAAACAGGWLLAGPAAALAAAAGGPALAGAVLRARRRRYGERLAASAPGAALALADALGAGHSIPAAIAAAARGAPEPAGRELRAAAAALAVGEPVEAALARLRAGGGAFETIAAALLLQREAGGPLATLLRDIAAGLADGARVEADARAATAQARFTAWLVAGLPLAAAALAELAQPGYARGLLASPLTAWLLGCAVALQAGALVAVRRIARVRG